MSESPTGAALSTSSTAPAIGRFLSVFQVDLEVQALKLCSLYNVDQHDLLSETGITIWRKWEPDLCDVEDVERYRYAAKVMFNHARNLSRKRRRDWKRCPPTEYDELLLEQTAEWNDPAMQALLHDKELRIYRAIAQLQGKQKDVMAMIASGFSREDVAQVLGIDQNYLRTILNRARVSLRKTLGRDDAREGGELL